MDEIDLKIARRLQLDGRSSLQELSRAVGLSRVAVSRRVHNLLDTGAISIVAVEHPSTIDQSWAGHISLKTDGPVSEVADLCAGLRATRFVSVIAGEFTIVVELRVASFAEFTTAVDQIRAFEHVTEISTLLYISVSKDLLAPTGAPTVTADVVDHRLINLLQSDGRASFASLASQMELSPSAVRARLMRLVDGGAIHVGAIVRRTAEDREDAMGVGVLVRDNPDALSTALVKLPTVEFLARALGRFDLILTLRARSRSEFSKAIEDIRSHPEVEKLQAWMHIDVVKETYTIERQLPPDTANSGQSVGTTSFADTDAAGS